MMGKPCNADTYRKATAKLCADNKCANVVEVGVYAGALSRMLAELPTTKTLTIVDSWRGDYTNFGQPHMDKIADSVIAWVATNPKVRAHRMDSQAGAELFADGAIDFFHTDGDHSLAGIMGDITAWLPKVKHGGILSGDNFEIPEVAKGVAKLLPGYQLLANGRLWWFRKP